MFLIFNHRPISRKNQDVGAAYQIFVQGLLIRIMTAAVVIRVRLRKNEPESTYTGANSPCEVHLIRQECCLHFRETTPSCGQALKTRI